MRIAIVGSGNVGGTLGTGWARAGHAVTFGTREPTGDKARVLLDQAPGARAATNQQAVADAEVVALATPWDATESVVRSLGGLAGKVLIDATNPLGPDFQLVAQPSGAELVAGWAPGARVVKAFNTFGFNVMADPHFGQDRATAFFCGDDAAAKETVAGLARDLGFEPLDCGPLSQAARLEWLATLWISLAFGGHGRDIAFRLMRR